MKLWYSFLKELKLASKSFYFYIELFFAIIILVVVLYAIPENFNKRSTEYLYLDMPDTAKMSFEDRLLQEDLDKTAMETEIKVKKDLIKVMHYETEDRDIYLANSEEDLILLADSKKQLGAVITVDSETMPPTTSYKYYLQGYETDRLKNLYKVIHNSNMATLEAAVEDQEVRVLSTDYVTLSDREHTMPSLLTFNGSLMGMFIVAAYIFLDKEQGIIKAYAVTASTVWQYLMSKTLVITVTSIVTTAIITIPVMGGKPDYLLMLLFLICTGFFASGIGLLISGYFRTMTKAFNVIYLLMVAMMLPAIAYFIPGWEPFWIRLLPAYYIIQGFSELIVKGGNTGYVLLLSLGFLAAGTILFVWAAIKHKKSLTA
ncbi:MAG TPA: ABC transporter permease [Clostridia bacterium]|nr:ABC transporter permease [Clostridia bacterium]HRX41446.1 ABC transporter permease [Clostridia bacterium]